MCFVLHGRCTAGADSAWFIPTQDNSDSMAGTKTALTFTTKSESESDKKKTYTHKIKKENWQLSTQ